MLTYAVRHLAPPQGLPVPPAVMSLAAESERDLDVTLSRGGGEGGGGRVREEEEEEEEEEDAGGELGDPTSCILLETPLDCDLDKVDLHEMEESEREMEDCHNNELCHETADALILSTNLSNLAAAEVSEALREKADSNLECALSEVKGLECDLDKFDFGLEWPLAGGAQDEQRASETERARERARESEDNTCGAEALALHERSSAGSQSCMSTTNTSISSNVSISSATEAEAMQNHSGSTHVGGLRPVEDNEAANATESSTVIPVEVGKGKYSIQHLHPTPTPGEPEATPTPIAGSGAAGEAEQGRGAGNGARNSCNGCILSLEENSMQPRSSARNDEAHLQAAPVLASCTPTKSANAGGYLPLCQLWLKASCTSSLRPHTLVA
jgi:hypothetical protein